MIYGMIYGDYQGMGAYARYLRHSHIKRQKRGGSHTKRGMIPDRVGIEQRPAMADLKIQIGHWEADTMIGGNHLGAMATYVDKASKFLIAQVSKNRTADAIYQGVAIAPIQGCQRREFAGRRGLTPERWATELPDCL